MYAGRYALSPLGVESLLPVRGMVWAQKFQFEQHMEAERMRFSPG
jgi:hypothetical protein